MGVEEPEAPSTLTCRSLGWPGGARNVGGKGVEAQRTAFMYVLPIFLKPPSPAWPRTWPRAWHEDRGPRRR